VSSTLGAFARSDRAGAAPLAADDRLVPCRKASIRASVRASC
jgi:hypothetical protein